MKILGNKYHKKENKSVDYGKGKSMSSHNKGVLESSSGTYSQNLYPNDHKVGKGTVNKYCKQDSVKVIFKKSMKQIDKNSEPKDMVKPQEDWEEDRKLHEIMKKTSFNIGFKSFDYADGKMPPSTAQAMNIQKENSSSKFFNLNIFRRCIACIQEYQLD